MDPNEDGNTDDKVDIVNLSLGGSYLSSYYDLRTEALEQVKTLGCFFFALLLHHLGHSTIFFSSIWLAFPLQKLGKIEKKMNNFCKHVRNA